MRLFRKLEQVESRDGKPRVRIHTNGIAFFLTLPQMERAIQDLLSEYKTLKERVNGTTKG